MWYFVVFQPSKCKKTHFQPQIWSIWPIFPNDSESLPKVCYIKWNNSDILSKLRNSESAGGSVMNIILFPKIDWLWILFGCPKMNVYEYDYCSATRKWPNTNTKIIRLPNNDYIQISFGWSNTIHKYNFLELPKRMASKTSSEFHKVMLNSPSPLMTEANYKCKQLPIHMTHPMWLWYMRINYSFGA